MRAVTGLRRDRRLEILPSRRRRDRRGPVSPLRDRLLPTTRPSVLPVRPGPARVLHHRPRPQVPREPLHLLRVPDGLWGVGQLLRARWPRLLPLPLLDAVRPAVQWLPHVDP